MLGFRWAGVLQGACRGHPEAGTVPADPLVGRRTTLAFAGSSAHRIRPPHRVWAGDLGNKIGGRFLEV